MDASQRGALMLVRFLAAALIALGVIELSLSWVEDSIHHTPMRIVDFLLPGVLFALGVLGLIKASSLAAWISDKLDE